MENNETIEQLQYNKALFTGRRNLVLVARYYYYTEIARMRFDDTLHILSAEEFFIAERTITDRINDYNKFLEELKKNEVSSSDLRKMFPSWDWSLKARKAEMPVFIKSFEG